MFDRAGIAVRFILAGVWLSGCVMQVEPVDSPSEDEPADPALPDPTGIVGIPIGGLSAADGATTTSGFRSSSSEVGVSASALSISEHTIVETDTKDFTESAGSVFKDSASDWHVVVISNIDTGSNGQYDYGCYQDSYAHKCDFNMTGAQHGPDPSVAVDWNGTNEFYQLYLSPGADGLLMWRSTDPCPTGTGPNGCATNSEAAAVWGTGISWDGAVSNLDFPTLVDDINNENLWVVANRVIGGVNRVVVMQIVESGGYTLFGPWAFPTTGGNCANTSGDTQRNPRAIMVGDDLWITYRNESENDIEFTKFDTTTQSFICNSTFPSNIDTDAPLPATQTCGTCGSPQYVMPDVADACKKVSRDAKIDVSDPNAATPDAVVAYSRFGCTDELEMRIRRSTDGGATWLAEIITGCKTSVHASVAFARTPEGGSVADKVHVMSMYESGTSPGGGSGLRPIKWISTDAGNNWASGAFIGTTQTTFPAVNGVGSCYWGDYDGLTADMANSTMYYFWGDGDNGTNSDWEIRAQGVNP